MTSLTSIFNLGSYGKAEKIPGAQSEVEKKD